MRLLFGIGIAGGASAVLMIVEVAGVRLGVIWKRVSSIKTGAKPEGVVLPPMDFPCHLGRVS